jgi:hypothetical protein
MSQQEIECRQAATFHPEGDRLVERAIQSFVTKLRCRVNKVGESWGRATHATAWPINNTPTSSTGETAEDIKNRKNRFRQKKRIN